MTEDQGSTNGAHGGVGHLLRMAKTQCGVSLAFAALRKADGGFAIATFPSLTSDPSWSVEAIDELVRQTWEDPHLSGGSVLVRRRSGCQPPCAGRQREGRGRSTTT